MVTIKTNLAHRENYGKSRALSKILYLVIHYTANDGDTDENNGIYFKNNIPKASAHYFVDDDSITQSVPDNYTAYHCGSTVGYKHPKCRNTNSIGVEICDDVKNGVIYPSAKTIANVLDLVAYLMKKYNIPKENVIRHYDVTGKLCPAYWCGSTEKDKKWKSEFWDKIGGTVTVTAAPKPTVEPTTKPEPAKSYNKAFNDTYTVTANSGLNMRMGASTNKAIVTTLKKGTKFRCYGYYTKNADGTTWLYGVANGHTGYCSKKYLI